jgi:hypothetical protein
MQRQHALGQCFGYGRRDAGGNDAQHYGIGIIELNRSRAEPGRAARPPADLLDRVMAGCAVEEDELGLHPLGRVLKQRVHAFDETGRLPDRPDLNPVHLNPVHQPFALFVTLVDRKMRRLGRGVSVELERHPRVAGAHDLVGDEAIFVFGVAKVARQALLGANHWVIEGRQAVLPNQYVVRNSAVMWPQPLLGCAMARFAAEPIFDLELRAPQRGINVVGMTFQAEFAVRSILQAEVLRDPFRAVAQQHFVCLIVLVDSFARFSRPDEVFILRDRRTGEAFDRTVTGVA